MDRYIPIGSQLRNISIRIEIIQHEIFDKENISSYIYKTPSHDNTASFSYSLIIIYIAIALMIILMIYIVIVYIWYRRGLYLKPRLAEDYRRKGGLEILAIYYTYKGIAKILREIFLDIRNRFCNIYCTPREVALRHNDIQVFKLFADIYEEIVYGSKSVKNISKIIDLVKKYLGENK